MIEKKKILSQEDHNELLELEKLFTVPEGEADDDDDIIIGEDSLASKIKEVYFFRKGRNAAEAEICFGTYSRTYHCAGASIFDDIMKVIAKYGKPDSQI